MEGPLDPGAVVLAEGPDALNDVLEVVEAYHLRAEDHLAAGIARLWLAPEVHDHLEQVRRLAALRQRLPNTRR